MEKLLPNIFDRERLRTHSIESSGKLKISPEQHWDFTAEDLKDLGEIGRGAYGSVNKMVHKPSGQIMAVKVGDAHPYICTSVHWDAVWWRIKVLPSSTHLLLCSIYFWCNGCCLLKMQCIMGMFSGDLWSSHNCCALFKMSVRNLLFWGDHTALETDDGARAFHLWVTGSGTA